MSPTWLDEAEMESAEYDESEAGEAYDEGNGEGEYGEESRSSRERRRQAYARRVALARRRQELARARAGGRRYPGVVPPRPSTDAAIRTLDLETKVQGDTFRGAVSSQNRRMSRSEYAAVAGAATNQFIESFDAPDNPYFRAGLRFAPLLLLAPQKRGTGFGAFVTDPRVIGLTAVAAITVLGENRERLLGPRRIDVLAAGELAAGADDRFVAEVVDSSGRVISDDVAWSSDDANVATIDPSTGKVHGQAAGTAIITATFDGLVRRVRLKVT
jgi:Bacterial Ig-like domain (group 2)